MNRTKGWTPETNRFETVPKWKIQRNNTMDGVKDAIIKCVQTDYRDLSKFTTIYLPDWAIPSCRSETFSLLATSEAILESHERQTRVIEGINTGLSFEEIANQSGCSVEEVYTYADKITKPDTKKKRGKPKGTKRLPERDLLIAKGLSLEEIGRRTTGCTHETIRIYINSTGQYESYRTLRDGISPSEKKERKEKEPILSYLVGQIDSLVNQRLSKLTGTERKAYEKAIELENTSNSNPKTIPFQTLVELFRRYYDAEEKGEKASFIKLGSGLIKNPSKGIRYFEKVGLESLCYTRDNETFGLFSKEQKNAMKRACSVNMSSGDLAYFIGLDKCVSPSNSLIQFWVYNGLAEKRPRFERRAGIKSFGKSKLTYRLASQIYEAQDAGFTASEVIELSEADPKAIDYASEHRLELETKIIGALKILYPNTPVNKPYKNFR